LGERETRKLRTRGGPVRIWKRRPLENSETQKRESYQARRILPWGKGSQVCVDAVPGTEKLKGRFARTS